MQSAATTFIFGSRLESGKAYWKYCAWKKSPVYALDICADDQSA